MRKGAVLGFALAFLMAMAGVVILGLTRGSDLVYSPGATAAAPLVPVASGQTACQGPLRVPRGGRFDRVAFTVGTYGRRGPALRVEVRDERTHRRLAAGALREGYADIARAPVHVVPVGRVDTAVPLEVCITDVGERKVALYGQPGIAAPRSRATVDGTPVAFDIALTLRRNERSLIALLPAMGERAGLFRAGWVTPLTYLILLVALVVGTPVLLARGLSRAAAADD
jgi:hypothetical protein